MSTINNTANPGNSSLTDNAKMTSNRPTTNFSATGQAIKGIINSALHSDVVKTVNDKLMQLNGKSWHDIFNQMKNALPGATVLRGLTTFILKAENDKAFRLWQVTVAKHLLVEDILNLEAIMFNEGGWKAPTRIVESPGSRVYGYFQFTQGTWSDRLKLVTKVNPSPAARSLSFIFKASTTAKPISIEIEGLSGNDAERIAAARWGSSSTLDQVIPMISQSLALMDKFKSTWRWNGECWSYNNYTTAEMNALWGRSEYGKTVIIVMSSQIAGKQFILTHLNIQGLNWFRNVLGLRKDIEFHDAKRIHTDVQAFNGLTGTQSKLLA